MPGLSQLKKFNSDLLALGDETNLRAARGEKPVKIEIPKDIEDKNDSEDFVLGMPEIEAEADVSTADEDLSDLTALVNPSAAPDKSGKEEPAPSFEAPDMSALLNPVAPPAADDDAGMPDLSMFDEPEEEPEEIIEEEPEEVSIADMGLDALLAGGGFDEPEPEEESKDFSNGESDAADSGNVDLDNFEEIPSLDDLDSVPAAETIEEPEPVSKESAEDMLPLDGMGDDFDMSVLTGGADTEPEAEPLNNAESVDEVEPFEDAKPLDAVEPLDTVEPLDEIPSLDDAASLDESQPDELQPLDEASDLDIPSLDDVPSLDDIPAMEGAADESIPLDEASTFDEPAPLEDTAASGDLGDFGDFDIPDAGEAFDEPAPLDEAAPLEEPGVAADAASLDEASSLEDLGSFDLDSLDAAATPEESSPVEDTSFDAPAELDDFDSLPPENFDEDSTEASQDASEISGAESSLDDAGAEASGIPDGLFDAGDFDLGGGDTGTADTADAPAESGDFDFDNTEPVSADFSAEEDIPDFGDFGDTSGLDDMGDGGSTGEEGSDENAPLEVFDTSEMEGMDFGIQDTDAQLSGGGEGDFEFGSHDDFAMEGEFEIPGFSDVATAKEEKSQKTPLASGKDKGKKGKGKAKKGDLDEPDFSMAEEAEDLPPNTLSDEQYKTFLANLAEYPLNVRLAFEDFIVQDEFTDDAEFEIIEKILNKAPARQVAGMLEKMLDTSIPIPRDFEHRTAAEYEAYKKSLSYQLRNKIIPGVLLGLLLTIVGWGLFKFSVNCIYRPLKANSLYKQGYALLEADEYPQAEMKFDEAASKRINKKWFFKYARGYREHKQYQRAGKMYQNILRYYRHNKDAGLEYADMELNDLANYERAEEIVRREVLDYHINDADGILKLGDVFLEWGTEKDPSKLELAREQYATLIQLYKPTDLYLSRMMRYFIRTDNLREVIQMQKTFEPREKSLGSEDWAELSGYLLDKYYGALAPSEEYLRYEIEGLRNLLLRAVKTNPDNPIAQYNLAKYFINSGETGAIERTLQTAIEKFNTVPSMKKRDLYKYIDSYRLLGEHYIGTTDYLQAQEQFAEGISLYTTERDNAGFEGTPSIGKLYEDMGNIKYTISGDYDDALLNYKYSVELENDSPAIRYRIGYIQYKKSNYTEALGAFMKAGDGNIKERNLMLAMANTLSIRGDEYAAEGYYNQLLDDLDDAIAEQGLVFPQANIKDYDIVNTYLHASNNYGVTLYKLAKRTGNSALNAKAIVQFSQSVRAWDALTRNQDTLVRLEGSNLAEQNIKYITHPVPEFEPAIYMDISKTLLDNERL